MVHWHSASVCKLVLVNMPAVGEGGVWVSCFAISTQMWIVTQTLNSLNTVNGRMRRSIGPVTTPCQVCKIHGHNFFLPLVVNKTSDTCPQAWWLQRSKCSLVCRKLWTTVVPCWVLLLLRISRTFCLLSTKTVTDPRWCLLPLQLRTFGEMSKYKRMGRGCWRKQCFVPKILSACSL